MSEFVKNFFSEKTFKQSSSVELKNFSLYALLIVTIQLVLINLALIDPTPLTDVFIRISNITAVIGIGIFALSLLSEELKRMSKFFFYSFSIFTFGHTLLILSLFSFNRFEILMLSVFVLALITLNTKKIFRIIAILVLGNILIALSYLQSGDGTFAYIMFFLLSSVLIGFVQFRSISQNKYLASTRDYLLTITNSNKDYYFIIDEELKIKSSNSLAINYWGEGYLKTLEDKKLETIINKEFKDSVISDAKRALSENIQVEKEMQLISSSGNSFWVIGSLSSVRLLDKKFLSFTVKDITQIKRAEETLRDALTNLAEQTQEMSSTQKAMINMLEDIEIQKRIATKNDEETKTILENIADAVIVLDRNRNISIVNKATVKLTGFSELDLVQKNYEKVIKVFLEKENSTYTEYLDKAYKGEIATTENNCILLTKGNEKININISIAPTFDKNNQVERCVLIIKNVSKARQLEKMKDEFVSIASHQLRTPLTAIKWHAELIEESKDKLPKELGQSVNFISEGSERLIHLVSELLDVSRIDTGRNFDILKTEQDIVKILLRIIEETRILAENKNIKVVKNFDEKTSLKLMVDSFKISEAIENIVSNAIKYSKENSQVEIEIAKSKTYLKIKVTDSGVGIPESEQNRIFERFYRAKNAVTLEGTGLGLYITKAIIDAHQGELSFISKENKGTSFTIKLPFK